MEYFLNNLRNLRLGWIMSIKILYISSKLNFNRT